MFVHAYESGRNYIHACYKKFFEGIMLVVNEPPCGENWLRACFSHNCRIHGITIFTESLVLGGHFKLCKLTTLPQLDFSICWYVVQGGYVSYFQQTKFLLQLCLGFVHILLNENSPFHIGHVLNV